MVNSTAELFHSQIPHNTPEEMRAYLEQDAFIFSGLRTHTQLAEARSYLTDENGNLRAYHDFEQKVLKINKQYNRRYLEVEYNFAATSSLMAANWANHQEDTQRYWLEYRITGINTRPSHEAMKNICLPKTDPFWQMYYPPNGWECHCDAVDVLAREKTLSDSKKAQELGELATTQIGKDGKNKLAMFRFNPGIQKKMFPPNNSYNPKFCSNGKTTLSLDSNNVLLSLEDERCKAKQIIEEKAEKLKKERRKTKDKELKDWVKKYIPEDTGLIVKSKQFKNGKLVINRKGARSVYSHFTEPHLKDLVKDIAQITYRGQFKSEVPINKDAHNYESKKRAGIESFRYYISQHKGYNIRVNTIIIKGIEVIYSINLILK